MTASHRLDELTKLITDGKHGDCVNEKSSGYYFISSKDVKNNKVNYENARQIRKADFLDTHRRTQFEPGDILITNSGTIGRMAFAKDIPETSRTTFQKSVAIVKPDPTNICPSWLYLYLQFDMVRVADLAGGAAQKNLLLKDLRAIKINVPPLPIQQKIARILSAYDDLIENNLKRIKLLEEMAQITYEQWFVRMKFPGHETTPMDAETGLPEGWKNSRLGGVLILKYGKALKADNRKVGTVPVYGSAGVVGSHDESLVDGPGVIVGRKGNVGSVFWSNTRFFPIDTVFYVTSELPLLFVFFLLRYIEFINNDAAVPGLNRNAAYMVKIKIPPLALIRKFSVYVDRNFQGIEVLSQQNQLLKEARDILLPRLMTGMIDVDEIKLPAFNSDTEAA